MLIRWVSYIARISALLALLVGADDLNVRPANAWNLDRAIAFLSPVIGTAAEAAETVPHMSGQVTVPASPGGTLDALFTRGDWLGRFAAGFLGSGLLGLLFGRGIISGLSGMASYAGLLCQIVLLAMLCRLIWTLWRGPAALSPRQLAAPYLRSRDDLHGSFQGGSSAETDTETQRRSAGLTSPRGRS